MNSTDIQLCPCCGKPKRQKIDGDYIAPDGKKRTGGRLTGNAGYQSGDYGVFNGTDRTAPATPLARVWQGHRYGLQALKPALEPIIVFQKPYEGRPVDSIVATGAGALNIDGARIEHGDDVDLSDVQRQQHDNNWGGIARSLMGKEVQKYKPNGRWPANLLLVCCGNDPHDEQCPVQRLGAQSGESKSTGGVNAGGLGKRVYGKYSGDKCGESAGGFGDTGTAARFFYNSTWMLDRLEAADPVMYAAKASRRERDAGLEGFAVKPSLIYSEKAQGPLPQQTPSKPSLRRNNHPTIKPLSVAQHLATLLLPPAAYGPRRLFVPFAGAGSEMIGGLLAGWEHVEGVELEQEHTQIAEARLSYWQQQRYPESIVIPARKPEPVAVAVTAKATPQPKAKPLPPILAFLEAS